MSFDITLEAKPARARRDFDGFARTSLPLLAQALSLIVDDQDAADAAVHEATIQAHRRWDQIGFDDEPERWFFSFALDRCSDDAAEELVDRASVVAHLVLSWPVADVASVLGVGPADVDQALETTASAQVEPQGSHDSPVAILRANLRSEAAAIEISLPDLGQLKRAERTRRRGRVTVLVTAALLALAVVGTLIANVDRASSATPVPPPQATTMPDPGEATVVASTPVPAQTTSVQLVDTPRLISTDGAGGFVGATPAGFLNPRGTEFSTSSDGQVWEFAGQWTLKEDEHVERFERVGESYFAWVVNPTVPDQPTIKIGMSQNLTDWTTLKIPVDNPTPQGLTFSSSVLDIAASGSTVLALVETDVRINFADFNLTESYTCGTERSTRFVTIKLCNGGLLDIGSGSPDTSLPGPHQLYLSEDSGPFVAVSTQFEMQPNTRLAMLAGRYALNGPTGLPYVVSPDGRRWTIFLNRLAADYDIASVDANGTILSLDLEDDEPTTIGYFEPGVLLHGTELRDVLGYEPAVAQVGIESGPAGWAVIITEAGASSVLFSQDGLEWQQIYYGNELYSTRTSESPRAFIGSEEVLVQTINGLMINTLPTEPP